MQMLDEPAFTQPVPPPLPTDMKMRLAEGGPKAMLSSFNLETPLHPPVRPRSFHRTLPPLL